MSNIKEINNFLYQSISDTQGTIRAIDVKLGFLFVVIFMPLASLDTIAKVIKGYWGNNFLNLLIIIAASCWFLSLWFLFSASSIVRHMDSYVKSPQKINDVFFGGSAKKITMFDIFSRQPIQSIQTFDEFLKSLPKDDDEISKHLAMDKMKVSYIREVKSSKTSICFILIFIWLSIGLSMSIFYYLKIGVVIK